MRLSTRLTLAMVGLVLLTAAAVGYLTDHNIEAIVLQRNLERIESRARVLADELEAGFRGRERRRGGLRLGGGGRGHRPRPGRRRHRSDRRNHLGRVADPHGFPLCGELAAKPSYRAFRIVGLDDGGRDIVRVDRSGPDGAIRSVPDAALERQAEGALQETIKLPAGEVYISPIGLSRENGVIEEPHVPVLHFATPLQKPDGTPFGMVIITLDLRPAFTRIRSAANEGLKVFLVNGRGDYLVHPDAAREFGFEIGMPFRVQDDFPDIAPVPDPNAAAPRVLRDRAGTQFGVGWGALRLAQGPRVAVIETIPYAGLMAAAIAVRESSLFAGLLAVLGAIALAVMLARSLSRPLVQMTRAVEGFARDEPAAIPTDAGGEIGRLAQAFARMADEVRDKTAALLDSERMARGIVNSALDGFVQMDERGIIVDWNAQAQAIFGWSRAQAVGKVLGELIVPLRHRARHQEGLARYLRGGESAMPGKRLQIEALRRDGTEIKVELSITALLRRGGVVFNGFIRDMTEAIAAEERTRQSEKMEAVGQLVGGIAHDFNNLLTVITGTIDILAQGVADKPQLLSIARLIGEAADRGAELTGHLLAFARKQPLQPHDTDINGLVTAAEGLFRRALGAQIEIEARLERSAWPALVDPTQLTTALLNLAINARDAMPDGGKLTLETKNVVLDDSYAGANRDVEPGNYVMIAVSDTGNGIPEAILDRVFEPFFSTKAAGKGTGLGLSMVYGFVKQSSGHIRIYSEDGHGTTIRIYLPRSSMPAEQAAAPAPEPPARRRQRNRPDRRGRPSGADLCDGTAQEFLVTESCRPPMRPRRSPSSSAASVSTFCSPT